MPQKKNPDVPELARGKAGRVNGNLSPRVGFHRPGRPFCTGSSIMPQKKNPDVPELARGRPAASTATWSPC